METNYWRENFRRSLRDWDGRELMVGLLVIALTAFGYGVWKDDPQVMKWASIVGVGYFGLLVTVVSPWRMWRDAQERIADYEARLRPQLSFVFEPDVPPFVHNFTLRETGKLDRNIRTFRVGIRNDSGAIIRKARVVI